MAVFLQRIYAGKSEAYVLARATGQGTIKSQRSLDAAICYTKVVHTQSSEYLSNGLISTPLHNHANYEKQHITISYRDMLVIAKQTLEMHYVED